jgi:hypothetical protein
VFCFWFRFLFFTPPASTANSSIEFETWALLPVLCAEALRAQALSPATAYLPAYGAMLNNCHVLTLVVNKLVPATMAVVTPEGDNPVDVIAAAQRDFVRIAGVELLRLVAAPGAPAAAAAGRDGAIIALDMVRLCRAAAVYWGKIWRAHTRPWHAGCPAERFRDARHV